jgi:hypothetical protein
LEDNIRIAQIGQGLIGQRRAEAYQSIPYFPGIFRRWVRPDIQISGVTRFGVKNNRLRANNQIAGSRFIQALQQVPEVMIAVHDTHVPV